MTKDSSSASDSKVSAVNADLNRRQLLSALSASGVISLAGCMGGDDEDGNGGNGGSGNDEAPDDLGFVEDATFTSFIEEPPSEYNWSILTFRTEWPRYLYGYCLDMLAWHDENLELQPQAAVDWGWDAEEFWVELRDDLYWSDGTQITAADVFMVHKVNRYLDGRPPEQIREEGGPNDVWEAITDVEIDGQTGRLISEDGWFDEFYMEQFADEFLTHPTLGEIYADSRIYEEPLAEIEALDDPYSEEAVDIAEEQIDNRDLLEPTEIRTSGAWQIAEVREDSVLLEPNEHFRYYEDINFDEIELQVHAEEATRWNAIQGDILDTDPGLFSNPPAEMIDGFPDHIQDHALDEHGINETLLIPQGNHPLLGRLNVRRAIMHALDKEVIAQNEHPYAASAPQGPPGIHVPEANQWIDDDLAETFQDYNYDEEMAVQYLEEEGFTRENGEWYTPDGDRFGFELLTSADTPNVERTVQSQLENFGIEVTLRSEEDAIFEERRTSGDFEVIVHNWVGIVQGMYIRALQQSARRLMWGIYDEEEVQDWIEANDHIVNEEYDWTNNIENFELEDLERFELEAPPVGEPDAEPVGHPIPYMDFEWGRNISEERREEIMQTMMWTYNWRLDMMPITVRYQIAFQNHRDWFVPSDDTEWLDTGPGPIFSLMNRGKVQADPDGQHN